jgi:hypothetical protein
MSIEIDVLGEIWLTTKEYIAAKDRQAAADHVLSVVADHNITERELKSFASTDAYLKRALKEYMGDDEAEDPMYDNDNDKDDDY